MGIAPFETRNGYVSGHPDFILPPSPRPSSPVRMPCWYTGVASQMISNNRQALPPLLPTSFCQESTSMENTIIISSLHHTGRQNASRGRRRRRVKKDRRTDRKRQKRATARLVLQPLPQSCCLTSPVPIFKHTSNTVLAFRRCSVCMCV